MLAITARQGKEVARSSAVPVEKKRLTGSFEVFFYQFTGRLGSHLFSHTLFSFRKKVVMSKEEH